MTYNILFYTLTVRTFAIPFFFVSESGSESEWLFRIRSHNTYYYHFYYRLKYCDVLQERVTDPAHYQSSVESFIS